MSEEKGQRQQVNLLGLDMKENNATGYNSTFLGLLFSFFLFFLRFWTLFAKLGVGKKNASYFRNQFRDFKNYIFVLHITQMLIFVSYFDQTNYFWQNLTSNAIFPIRIPVKNVFLGQNCQRHSNFVLQNI